MAILALVIASLIWGLTGPLMKLALEVVPIFTLATIRFGIACILLAPFVYKHLKIDKKHIPTFIMAGLFGIGLHIPLLFWGFTLTSILNVVVLNASTPLFTLLFANLFLKEKITKNLVIGGVVGMIGIIVIIARDIAINGISASPFGNLLILISILFFVTYEIISKKLFKVYSSSTVTWYSFLIGTLAMLPFALYENVTYSSWVNNIDTTIVLEILYGIFFSSLAAYSLWQWGLSLIPASRVGFFIYLDPLTSTVAAVLLLGETITIPFVIGALFVFLGLFIAEGKFHYHYYFKQLLKTSEN